MYQIFILCISNFFVHKGGLGVKIVVVGSGKLGQRHLDVWSRMEGVEIVGVIARNKKRLHEVAEKYQTNAYLSITEAIASTNVDLFDICTPTHTHVELIIEAAQAGKHVICEKPLALYKEDAKKAISICEQNQVHLLIGHTLRFFPEYFQARKSLLNDEIGEIGMIRMERGVPHPPKSWYGDEEKSGGLFLDLGIHDFDWLLWSVGDVHTVMANDIKYSNSNELAYGMVTLRMVNGSIAYVELSWAEPEFYSLFEISGSKGMISYDSRKNNLLEFQPHSELDIKSDEKEVKVPSRIQQKDPFYRQLEHFLNVILGKEFPIVTAKDAMKAVELSEAIIKSAKNDQPVSLNVGGASN